MAQGPAGVRGAEGRAGSAPRHALQKRGWGGVCWVSGAYCLPDTEHMALREYWKQPHERRGCESWTSTCNGWRGVLCRLPGITPLSPNTQQHQEVRQP